MKVEVADLGFPVPNKSCGFCGGKATLNGALQEMNMVLKHRHHKAFQGRGEGGVGVGGRGRLYTYRYTVINQSITRALRWAAVRAV